MFPDIRKVDVLIEYGPGFTQNFSLVEFLHSPVPPDPSQLPGNTAMNKRNPGTHRAQRGFTLIEMMLAIGVLALILAMLASSFSAVAHSKVHAEGRLMVDREGRPLLWQMTKEVTNAVQTPYAPSNVALVGGGHMGGGKAIDTT